MYLQCVCSVDTLDTKYLHLCTCCRAASENSSALVILTSRGLDTLGQIIVWDMINDNVTRSLHWYGQWRPCLHCDRGDGCGSSHHKTPSLSTGCCKTSVKLWKHITETLYGVSLCFWALVTVKYGRFFTLVLLRHMDEIKVEKIDPESRLDFRVGSNWQIF